MPLILAKFQAGSAIVGKDGKPTPYFMTLMQERDKQLVDAFAAIEQAQADIVAVNEAQQEAIEAIEAAQAAAEAADAAAAAAQSAADTAQTAADAANDAVADVEATIVTVNTTLADHETRIEALEP